MKLTTNTTCDIFRSGNAPPSAADVAAVPCLLRAMYALGLETDEGGAVSKKFTHVLDVDYRTDIRDDYDAGTVGANADTVYVPDAAGTPFTVVFVEGHLPGDPARNCKRVYLARQATSWPTQQL